MLIILSEITSASAIPDLVSYEMSLVPATMMSVFGFYLASMNLLACLIFSVSPPGFRSICTVSWTLPSTACCWSFWLMNVFLIDLVMLSLTQTTFLDARFAWEADVCVVLWTYKISIVRVSVRVVCVTDYLRNRSKDFSETRHEVRGKKCKKRSTAAFLRFWPVLGLTSILLTSHAQKFPKMQFLARALKKTSKNGVDAQI